MTTQEKLVRGKLSLLELAEYLNNVSQACKINGVSRQHFYDIRKTYEEHGLEGLAEKTRKKPCMKNRVSPEIEDAVLRMANEFPAYGQMRASNELRKAGILVSGGGVRSIWLRHDLETFKKRLCALEKKAAAEGIVYIEAQLSALEASKRSRESNPDEIQTEHPAAISLARIHSMSAILKEWAGFTSRPASIPILRWVLPRFTQQKSRLRQPTS
jgi:hypothetical protein